MRSRRHRTTLDLPTAEGPDSTTTRPLPGPRPALTGALGSAGVQRCPARLRAELFQQGLALTITEAAQTAGRGDLELGHDFLRLDLANLRQCFQQCRNLHLAQDLIALSVLQDLLEVGAATLESILQFSSRSTCGSSLLQRCRALLVSQLGKGHGFLRLSPSSYWPSSSCVLTG